jgi:hypothetical protein
MSCEDPNEGDADADADDLEYVYSEDDDDDLVEEHNNGTSRANPDDDHLEYVDSEDDEYDFVQAYNNGTSRANPDDDGLECVDSEGDDYDFVKEYNNGTSTANHQRKHNYSPIVNAAGTVNTNKPPLTTRMLPAEKVATPSPFDESSFGNRKKNYQTISTKNLVPLMEQHIMDTAEVLDIPTSAAVSLLCDWQWNKQRLLEAYMNDQQGTLRKAGVTYRCFPVPEATNRKIESGDCPICMESISDGNVEILSMPCGHTFCKTCWHEYLHNLINLEGTTCMAASCPDATCQERLSQHEVEKAAPNLLEKFKNYRLNNFADAIGRWCPGPGCDRVVCKILSGTHTDSCVTDCNECGTVFCIDCLEEPHAPVSCRILRQWQEKDKDEAATLKWMTINTKEMSKLSSSN